MAKAPAFQWYPKDADSDERVRMMDDAEFGFYVRCLNHAWINDGLPENAEDLARVMNRPLKTVEKYWKRVGGCFEIINGRLRNPRLEQQRKESEDFKASKSEAAKARWNRRPANTGALLNGCIPDARAYADALKVHTPVQCSASASSPASASANHSMTEDDFAFLESVWESWVKQRAGQARDVVFRMVMGSDRFDWAKFKDRAPKMLAHYAGLNPPWQYASLTLWDWIEGGMILPPAVKPAAEVDPMRDI